MDLVNWVLITSSLIHVIHSQRAVHILLMLVTFHYVSGPSSLMHGLVSVSETSSRRMVHCPSLSLWTVSYCIPKCTRNLKMELRSIYSQLCQDDMPRVRRSAASNLGKFAATVEYAHLKADIMTIFEDLTQDGNE